MSALPSSSLKLLSKIKKIKNPVTLNHFQHWHRSSSSSSLHTPHHPLLLPPTSTLRPPAAASTAPTVAPPVRQGEAVVSVLVAGVEDPSPTPPPHPPPPPLATAAACHTSLCHQGALQPTGSAASPPTIRALCPRMRTSTPSRLHPCPQTSLARYKQ